MTTTHAPLLPILAILTLVAGMPSQSWLPASPLPNWNAPTSVTTLAYDPARSPTQNGADLHVALGALQPGDGLAIGPGTWSVPFRLDLSIQATASQPVWVFASDPNDRPVITRPDNQQNCLNVGSLGVSRFLVLRDLEFTGGSDLIRIYDGSSTWIDGCYLHDGDGVGIAVQTQSCTHLYVTRNEIARPGPGNGEAIYLGGNFGSLQVTDSVVAFNHVHDTRMAVPGQGDGIELKQGSTRNWIAWNHVHDCKNPCILVYGTGGVDENVVEGNLCYDSDDVVLQVQGEAIVRNNVAIGGSRAFTSFDHQGISQHLQLLHNTFVNVGRACELSRWGGRPGMVFANNACYSTSADSLYYGIGDQGVLAAGNVLFGPSNQTGTGYRSGAGLSDFVAVDPATFLTDARPRRGGALDNVGDPEFALPLDLTLTARRLPVDPGARRSLPTLLADVATIPAATGGVQTLQLALGAGYANQTHVLAASTSGTMPLGTPALLEFAGFHLPLVPDWLFVQAITGQAPNALPGGIGTLDAQGRTTARVVVPALGPAAAGLTITACMASMQGGVVTHVSNTVTLTLQ
ncbi:MAG: right-handed parallel beta-helix repeat-containing protein [Planctomycetota bacterium]